MAFGVSLRIIQMPACLIAFCLGQIVRQSLSSRTVDTILRFQQGFVDLKEKFNSAVDIQTLKVVVESHEAVKVLKVDLRNIGDILVAQADKGRYTFCV
jgi:hypothetical protein